MALGYTGDQTTLNRYDNPTNAWYFVTLHEGSVIWVDFLAVVDRSRHRELALKFIDFINDARNAADNAIYLKIPTPNEAAIRLLPKAIRNDPKIYPASDIIVHSQLRRQTPAASLQLRRRIVSALVNSNDAQ